MNEETPTRMRLGVSQVVIGVLIIAIGSVFLLRNLGFDVPRVGKLWPVALIVIGAAKVSREGLRSFWGNALMVLGVLFLLENFRLLPFDVFDLWPVGLIVVGLRVVTQGFGVTSPPTAPLDLTSDGVLTGTAVFGGGDRKLSTPDFKGGKISAIFGGFDIDLTECQIKSDRVVLDVVAIFGGCDIKVPPGWKVVSNVVAVFGGCDVRVHSTPNDAPTLFVTGTAIFGGVEIKS